MRLRQADLLDWFAGRWLEVYLFLRRPAHRDLRQAVLGKEQIDRIALQLPDRLIQVGRQAAWVM
jgi:hypothetical protein